MGTEGSNKRSQRSGAGQIMKGLPCQEKDVKLHRAIGNGGKEKR